MDFYTGTLIQYNSLRASDFCALKGSSSSTCEKESSVPGRLKHFVPEKLTPRLASEAPDFYFLCISEEEEEEFLSHYLNSIIPPSFSIF